MKPLVTLPAVALGLALVVGAAFQYRSEHPVAAAPAATTTLPSESSPPLGPGTDTPIRVQDPPRPDSALPPLLGVELEMVARQLDQPLYVTSPPNDPRLFVVEKPGRIQVLSDGKVLEEPFLDLVDRVDSDGAELGMLGLVFHPGYQWNGKFYVYYTDVNEDTRLEQYRVSQLDPNRAEIASARLLLFLDQPQAFHQGGMLEFGLDGYLYISAGDGGGIGDQYGNGQNTDTLHGSILRLDVDNGEPYAIPPDNPFVDGGGAPEIWAYGLRNPWRTSIDHDSGRMYIGDVGQAEWEEINVIPLDRPGLNLGWPVREGKECFEAESCAGDGFVEPVITYSHRDGCAVIGGYVYRGAAIPELHGTYFYGDWCGQWVRSFRYEDGRAVARGNWRDEWGRLGPILSFGTDAEGELYIASMDGNIYKMVPRR